MESPSFSDGHKIRITAKVNEEPRRYQKYQSFSLSGIKIFLPVFPEIHYGDKVKIEGVVRDNKIQNPTLIEVFPSEGFLIKFREKLLGFYKKFLPEPHASLVSGIVLGVKSDLPLGFWESLKKTGTLHVVVASGMNVTFVAGFLLSVFTLFLPRKKAIPWVLAGITGYAALAGFEAPIVRAAIMGGVAFLAQELGRLVSTLRIFILSALIMLAVRPDWIGDLGFILSFVATGSLLVFTRRVEGYFKRVPAPFREGFSTSLAAQIGVSPILFVTFGQFNILSPFINALVLWTIPFIMAIGALAGIVGVLIPFLGRTILYLIFPLTSWFVFLVNLFGS